MSDSLISNLTAITGANLAAGDLFPVVDVSDPTLDAAGTTKKITKAELASVMGTDLTNWLGLAVSGTAAPKPDGVTAVPSFIDPTSTTYVDGGWWNAEYQTPDISINWGFGDLAAPASAWGNLYASQDNAYVYVAQYHLNAYMQMTASSAEASLVGQAVVGQTSPALRLSDSGGTAQTQIQPDGSVGFFAATPHAQVAAGTTAADAIACLKAFGLMAA